MTSHLDPLHSYPNLVGSQSMPNLTMKSFFPFVNFLLFPQLKSKLTEIEESLAERELKTMSDDLRNEYDRQLENIRNLKALYEERSRVATIEKENLRRDLERIQSDFDAEKTK